MIKIKLGCYLKLFLNQFRIKRLRCFVRAKFHFDHESWGIGFHVKFFHLSHCCYDWYTYNLVKNKIEKQAPFP